MENKRYFRYFVLKKLFQALYLEIKPLKSTMGAQGEKPRIVITQLNLNSGFK